MGFNLYCVSGVWGVVFGLCCVCVMCLEQFQVNSPRWARKLLKVNSPRCVCLMEFDIYCVSGARRLDVGVL